MQWPCCSPTSPSSWSSAWCSCSPGCPPRPPGSGEFDDVTAVRRLCVGHAGRDLGHEARGSARAGAVAPAAARQPLPGRVREPDRADRPRHDHDRGVLRRLRAARRAARRPGPLGRRCRRRRRRCSSSTSGVRRRCSPPPCCGWRCSSACSRASTWPSTRSPTTTYREQFFDRVASELRQTFAVRAAYLPRRSVADRQRWSGELAQREQQTHADGQGGRDVAGLPARRAWRRRRRRARAATGRGCRSGRRNAGTTMAASAAGGIWRSTRWKPSGMLVSRRRGEQERRPHGEGADRRPAGSRSRSCSSAAACGGVPMSSPLRSDNVARSLAALAHAGSEVGPAAACGGSGGRRRRRRCPPPRRR